jgi:hypothetical protein
VRPLTIDLAREDERPYFLWDEDCSVAEFRRALASAAPRDRRRLIGKLMREARDPDVWAFVTPREVFKAAILANAALVRPDGSRTSWQHRYMTSRASDSR